MNPERLIGLAYVAERWHGGQGSRLSRLSGKIRWQPRGQAEFLLPRDEWHEARRWAAHYTRLCCHGLR